MSIAVRLKQRREELDLTQEELANLAGIKQQTIQSIESGRTRKPRDIVSIADALKCSPNWLLNGGSVIPLTHINSRRIPLLSYVQAGELTEENPIREPDGSFEYVSCDDDIGSEAFALRIEGDSMTPDFREGDLVIIDPSVAPAPGEFVFAVSDDSHGTFKKYKPSGVNAKDFELIPLNQDYPVISSLNKRLRIVGTMVEQRISRRKR
ncbi:DNA-binding protein [Vibrio parahaemolyticus]|uniref:LexA family protein n=1 Tax=Vibrio parahaemolyticus TaxID=670 RepID=UPI00111FC933|nr:S24 family peptidase [Vibrio parahaemolyticus]TNZ90917.1 DNA-binding protein [Vibrio parahaemolyticus]